MRVYARLQKVHEARREVTGICACESPDCSGEIMDYASSKPYFESWSSNAYKISGGKSLGNIRESHQINAVGKVIDIAYDDDAKSISITGKIIDDSTWNKILEGVITSWSIGGRYTRRWPDSADKTLTRYSCAISEISCVDLPCLPNATFEVIRANGSRELRKFATNKDTAMKKDNTTNNNANTAQRLRALANLQEQIAELLTDWDIKSIEDLQGRLEAVAADISRRTVGRMEAPAAGPKAAQSAFWKAVTDFGVQAKQSLRFDDLCRDTSGGLNFKSRRID